MANHIQINSVTLTVPDAAPCPEPEEPDVCIDDPTTPCNECAIGPPGPPPPGPPGPPGPPPPPGPPQCGKTKCSISQFPIRLATGALQLTAVDISSEGYGVSWGHRRSFTNRISGSLNVGNGYNWLIQQWSYLAIQPDTIVVMGNPQSVLWFDKSGTAFVPRFNVRATLIYDASVNRYKLFDLRGNITEYCGITGRLCRYLDPYGNPTVVTSTLSNGFTLTEVQRTTTSSGVTTVESYLYDYIDPDAASPLLASVTLRRQVDGGGWLNVLQCSYTYYGSADTAGTTGDLRTATTLSWDGSDWVETGTSLYRYYTTASSSSSSSSLSSSSSSSGSNSFAHLLRFVLEPAAFNRMVADGYTPTTVSDAILSLYADYYFEYDSSRRVVREIVQSGSRMFDLEYGTSVFADGYNSWKRKTIETRPDDSTMTVYSNYAGQTMLAVLNSGDDQWCEYYRYDQNGFLILTAYPSAISGYDEQYADLLHEVDGNFEFLKDHEGFIATRESDPATGWPRSEKIQQGEFGTCIRQRAFEYTLLYPGSEGSSSSSSSSSSSGPTSAPAYFMTKMIVYPEDGCGCDSSSSSSSCSTGCCCSNDNTRQIVTSYDYLFYTGTTQIRQLTTTLPAIPIEQNGSGIAATRKDYFDTHGNLTWNMDERGYITRMKYHIPTGAMIQQIQDVDTTIETDAPGGWVTPADGGLNLITDFEHDDQGRIIQSLGPWHNIDINGTATDIRRANWIVYQDATFQTWSAQGYATGSSPSYDYTLINPVAIAIRDASGKILEQISAVRSSTSGKLLPTDSFPQSSYVRWTTTQYTDCCFAASRRIYHTIPESGPGTSGANYDETDYGYDVMKRQNRTVTPGGTITYRVFDVRGNAIAVYIGTNDNGATDEDPTGGGALGNNMVLVTEWEYDNGEDGADGNMTEITQHVDAVTARVTEYLYDWRDRQTAVDGEIDFYQQTFYDNLDRTIRVDRRNTTAEGNLIGRNDTLYDDHNRVCRTIRYGVTPTTGVIGNALTDNTWYDPSGNTIKSQPSGSQLFTKTTYDSLGRATISYSGYDLDETSYNEVTEVDDDVILEQVETAYDNASNAIKSIVRERYHNAPDTQTGPLQDPSNNPKARVTYSAVWPDSIARRQASANYGTNGGTAMSRPSTIPTRSDTVLVTSTNYDSAGNTLHSIDPSGMVTRFEYDSVGRQTAQLLNYQPSVSSSSSSFSSSSGNDCEPSADTNVTVLTSYSPDGNVSALTALNSSTSNQVTQYIYGTTLADSGIATSVLKRKEIYPDSVDEDDVIQFGYNRQSETVIITNQNGTVHEYDYDLLGRQTQDRVTVLGADVDDDILRIDTTYEVRGMKTHLTSYDHATVGTGSIVNDCQFVYNDFGQLITEYQSHAGIVDTDTTPSVRYTYADGTANTIRPEQLIYPNGRELTYDYSASEGINDAISRVASLIDDDGTTHLVDYSYLGLSTFVVTDYAETETEYTLVGTAGGDDPDSGDIYRGLDRFGRIKDSYWYNYRDSSNIDRVKYGYDRVANRLWQETLTAQTAGAEFDELYQYDQLHRLKHMDRGTMNGSHSGMSTTTFAQCWTLDESANWAGFREDGDGDENWDLIQSRTANPVNELTDIISQLGPSWTSPAYGPAGNMINSPQPFSPSSSYTLRYDAWHRLTEVSNTATATIISRYQYDGAKRRIVHVEYVSSVMQPAQHFFLTDPSQWQVIEQRSDSEDALSRQFVWGLRHIDDNVLRDRLLNLTPHESERIYAAQDANWNVTSLLDTNGSVSQRFAYSPFGQPQVLNSHFQPVTDLYDWETLYCGYHFDTTTGLYDVRNRTYHPLIGAWMQRDPVGLMAGSNLYEYALSSPFSAPDPSGLFLPVPLLIFAAAMTTAAACITGFLAGLATSLGIDFAACMLRQCVRVVPAWPPVVINPGNLGKKAVGCIAALDTCTAAAGGVIGCLANVAFPGVGGIGGGLLAYFLKRLGGPALKQLILKAAAKVFGKNILAAFGC